MRSVILFDMFLNPSFIVVTYFADVRRATASSSKYLHQEIFGNKVFICKIIFNFEQSKN